MENNNNHAEVFHYDLFGKREDKYDFLKHNSLATIPFKEIPNKAPMYFMVAKDFDVEDIYNLGFKVNEIFPLNNVGIVTARDEFTIHHTREAVKKTLMEFLSLDDETARVRFNLGKDVRDWQVNFAKHDLQNNFPNKGEFTQLCYRPFDIRWTYYTGKSRGFHCYPRIDVMQHFLKGENVGLVFKLGNAEEKSVSGMISKYIIDFRSWSRPGMQGGDYIAPLYLYPDTSKQQGIEQATERTPNLNMEIVDKIAEKLGLDFVTEKPENQDADPNVFAPIDILDYIYAVLHSPSYREKYKEFLKIDFPRVPYPEDASSFWQLVAIGSQLRQIHLLESPVVNKFITQYPVDGDNVVKKVSFSPNSDHLGFVYINDTQYFANVPVIAWNFYIGGYQPAQKWLKDRKGRALNFEDIMHYQKIIVALTETDRLMKEIDLLGIVK